MDQKRQNPITANHSKKMSSKEMQEILIENFVGLQRAMTNLSIKFESLSDQISRLLQIFEISARSFVSGQGQTQNPESNKDMLDKIDSLLEQNKTIAKGLVLMEENLRGKEETIKLPSPPERPTSRPLPRI